MNFNKKERDNILRLLSGLDAETAQNIVDEIVGIRMKGQIRKSTISLAVELVKRAKAGHFIPALALDVSQRREREQLLQDERQKNARRTPESAKVSRKAISEMQMMLKRPIDAIPEKEKP